MKDNYLYGASVQSIQNFIFETNKLKEMVGASELVEQLSRSDGFWIKFLKELEIPIDKINWIREAAGNVRFVCNKEHAQKIVLHFPLKVQEFAPGIKINQAVVKLYENQNNWKDLERNLRTQRNKPIRPPSIGLTVMERSPRTGKPAFKKDQEGKWLDLGTWKKQEQTKQEANSRLAKEILEENFTTKLPTEMDDLVGKGNNWVAIIHADGNGIGKLFKQLESQQKDYIEKSKKFSKDLAQTTKKAIKIAFNETFEKENACLKNNIYPFRPLIIGGDDITLLCRGDKAIPFTIKFLNEFQNLTKQLVTENNIEKKDFLTACAGVAFIKYNYPFHYGYDLAESLCKSAKDASKKVDKDNIPSSLAFHKIQDSFYEDYERLIEKELTIPPLEGQLSLKFGPYSIEQNQKLPSIEYLLDCVKILQKRDAPKAGLRRWLSELYKDRGSARQLLRRVYQIAGEKTDFKISEFEENLKELTPGLSLNEHANQEFPGFVKNKTPIYDMLTLLSLQGNA